MKEFITKDEYGSTVILKFSDTPNKKAEDIILEMLIRTYEDRLDVSTKVDCGGQSAYLSERIDAAVEKAVLDYLKKIKDNPRDRACGC